MKIGLYPLVGDLLHIGHLGAIIKAKEHCDYLIVALNVAPEGKDPVESVFERFMRLKTCKYVDEIIVYAGEHDLELLIRTIHYDIRFIGSDHNYWTGLEYEKEHGIEFYKIQRLYGISSTDLKKRIKEKEN